MGPRDRFAEPLSLDAVRPGWELSALGHGSAVFSRRASDGAAGTIEVLVGREGRPWTDLPGARRPVS